MAGNADVYIARLEAALEAYDRAANKFIDKVNSGRARSVETLRDLKECRELSRRAFKQED